MSNNDKFNDRIDDLFAESETPNSEPVEGGDAQNLDVESGFDPQDWSEGKLKSLDLSMFEGIGDRVGWDDFLNAIDRSEKIGFSYDGSGLSPITTGPDVDSNGNALEVPLQIGDEILGALQLEDEDNLPEDVSELMASVAQQVTQHVENLRLLAQAEQYRAEAEQASRRLTHEGWQEYLQSAIAPESSYFYDQSQVKAIDISQADIDQDKVNNYDLLVRGQAIGQISIADAQDDSERAAELISTITNRLSGHIENLRLLDETELSRQQLDKRAAEIETVAQVSTAAATILDPQALLQSVVDLTQYSFNLYHLNVYLLAEGGRTLEFAAGTGKIGQKMLAEGHTIQLGQKKSIIAKSARLREVVIVTDARKDPEFLHHHLLPDALSEMALPMIVADELIGVFDVEHDQVGRFTQDDIRTFRTLASQTAVALRNAQLYAEQMQTVERLRELDELKSSFLANMSHELRTPLNSILGFTQVILEGLDGPLTEDMETDLNLIHNSGQHLLALINDVLDMAKIEAGKLALSLENIHLASLLEDVLMTVNPLAREKSLSLEFENGLEDQMTIQADTVRLRQIMINLIGNAIKFTEAGGVTVRTSSEGTKVMIDIVDTGIGIPEDKLSSIFEAFSQVDTSTTRKAGGTGLGLPISRRLVELHGGRVWAESSGVAGEGSIFHLEFPIEVSELVEYQV